jgi:hypothetical protein
MYASSCSASDFIYINSMRTLALSYHSTLAYSLDTKLRACVCVLPTWWSMPVDAVPSFSSMTVNCYTIRGSNHPVAGNWQPGPQQVTINSTQIHTLQWAPAGARRTTCPTVMYTAQVLPSQHDGGADASVLLSPFVQCVVPQLYDNQKTVQANYIHSHRRSLPEWPAHAMARTCIVPVGPFAWRFRSVALTWDLLQIYHTSDHSIRGIKRLSPPVPLKP